MEENVKTLNELSKGASMGIDAIHMILPKVEDEKFKQLLQNQYEEYQKIEQKICDLYSKYTEEEKPKGTSTITKAMTWSGIEMNTLTDTSNSKIAELLMNGTNMWIIEGRKLLNHKEMDSEIVPIVKEYVTMQEKNIEDLKQYLWMQNFDNQAYNFLKQSLS